MTTALVTGVAGFIGSHVAEALRADGVDVRGVDNFMPYYDREAKEQNLAALRADSGFEFVEADLVTTDLDALLDGVDLVSHQAAQAGVRSSWAASFADYDRANILATQRLLDAVSGLDRLQRFVYASSSSIYGNASAFPCHEDRVPAPHSPYGLTKLAGELLCGVYAANWGVPTVALRYFTVFGPRQRPDMAFHRLFEAALTGDAFPLFGDGSAIRDFTYVGDVVDANLRALRCDADPGLVVNISGGDSVSMAEVIDRIGRIAGREIQLERHDVPPGDVRRTGGANDRARETLGWSPQVSLDDGLRAQCDWHRARR